MSALTVVLGDYPHTRPLKDRTIPVEGVDVEFVELSPLHTAFARTVRNLEFDVCEMAFATYFQAREAGVPITLLPVVQIGSTHHQSLTRLPDGPQLTPRQLVGQRVGVRAYSQTTGLWVRGILREEYGIESSEITWVTTEEPHVAQYQEPAYVERSTVTEVADLLRDGDVVAAVLGLRAVGGQGGGLVPVIEDAKAAGLAWIERHGTIPANHLVVVRDEVLRSDPDAARAVYRALAAGIAATAGERGDTPAGRAVTAGWSEPLAKSLEIGAQYALEQELVREPVDIGVIERAAAFFEERS